jgi:hypothetical protein
MELDSTQNPSHKPHLVGHLLREMESSVLGVIKPLTKIDPDDPCAMLLSELGIDEDSPAGEILKSRFADGVLCLNTNSKARQVKACLDLLECNDETLFVRLTKSKLHKMAHRHGLSSAKEITGEFRAAFIELVDAYLQLLQLCEASFVLWHKKVDELFQQQDCPKNLNSHLPRNQALMRYLFGGLDKSTWFGSLKKQGFLDFDTSLENEVYPQITYLIKVADKLPQEVLEVMMAVETDDPWLLRQFCDAAMKMPKAQCEVWAKRVRGWIESERGSRGTTLMYAMSKFVAHLIDESSEESFELSAVILDISEPVEDRYEKYSVRMDSYRYEKYLSEIIPRLAVLDSKRTANLLATLINDVIRLHWSNMFPDGDGSHVFWLPAIEDHTQNKTHYIEGSIAIALRQVIERGIDGGDPLSDWLEWLEKCNSLVYTRMSIHLVRRFGSDEISRCWLLNKDLFEHSAVLHEYLLLLRDSFERLSTVDQENILEWIDAIPVSESVPEEYRVQNQVFKKYRRLAFIQDHLPHNWKARYEEISAEQGEHDLDRLSFDRWMGTADFVDDKPPVPLEELVRMSVKELVDYLLGDIPVDDFREVTERGLEKAIEEAVSQDPDKYIHDLALLKNQQIKPLYIRGISNGLINGTAETVSDGVIINWAEWCVSLPPWTGAHNGEPYIRDHDDNKKNFFRWLESRMSSESENQLELTHRDSVFKVINAGVHDTDPEGDAEWGDPHSQAINSVRGTAMETAFSYGLWVLRNLEQNDPQSFDDLPELRDLLEERLDANAEPSPAIRSCYGLYLPQLCWMDAEWLKENLPRIFPSEPDGAKFFQAVWETYLLYGKCYRIVFDVLSPVYERAVMSDEIQHCEKDDPNSKVRDANMRLSSHLVLFYAWENINLSEESMLCRFMRRAASEYKTEVLRFMGSVLRTEKHLDADVTSRFQQFHEWWELEISEENSNGWKAYGEWFVGPYLDQAWKIKNLIKASKHGSLGIFDDEIFSILSRDYFESSSEDVLVVVENHIRHQLKIDQKWELDHDIALPDILRHGHHHENSGVRRKADELLGRLVSEGFMKYRDIAGE